MTISNTCLWIIVFIISVLFFLMICRPRMNGGTWLDESSASSASWSGFPRADAYGPPELDPAEQDKVDMDHFLAEKRKLPDGRVMTLSDFIFTFHGNEWQKKWHGETNTVEEYAYWLDRSSGRLNEKIWGEWMKLPQVLPNYDNIPQVSGF